MPIYEYECTSCNHHFDLMQKFGEEPAQQCPVCFENSVVKLISAAGFQLKGTGWYATDFKNKGISTNKEPQSTNTEVSKTTESAPDAPASPVKEVSKTTQGDAS